jgi:DNA-binding transcriptional ArsR family regulator
MNEEKPREIALIYKALGHPHRKKIIEIIGEKGKSGFQELHENLHISVGALYYHIDLLNHFITQDDQRKYILTERGKFAYKLLKTQEEHLSYLWLTEVKKHKGAWPRFLATLQRIFMPGRLFLYISAQPIQCILLTAVIVAFGAWMAAQARLEFILIFPNSLSKTPPALMATSFVVSWLVLFILCDFMATALFKRRGGNLTLLIGSSFSLLPLILFSCIWYASRTLNFSFTMVEPFILLLPFQVWTIGMMSTAISLSKGLNVEKAALICFVAIYVNLLYLVLRSNL